MEIISESQKENNDAKCENSDSGDDVDLSSVKLSNDFKSKRLQKTKSTKRKHEETMTSTSSVLKESKNSDEENASKKPNELDNQTVDEVITSNNKEQENSCKTKKPKETLVNSMDPKYWENIQETDYFRERSLSFKDILNRELGFSSRLGHGSQVSIAPNKTKLIYDAKVQNPRHFVSKAMNSLEYLRRMKMNHTLNYHEGCVNALNFNRIGTLLASGSDDFQVCLWDWAKSEIVLSFDSGHKSNVFQVLESLTDFYHFTDKKCNFFTNLNNFKDKVYAVYGRFSNCHMRPRWTSQTGSDLFSRVSLRNKKTRQTHRLVS